MSEIADYLKLGTTALVLDLLEDGNFQPPKLKNSLRTFHNLSKSLFKNQKK